MGEPPRLALRGNCNRCGLCCVLETPAGRVVCEHLRANSPIQPLGSRMASHCAIYERRQSGMAIRMLNARGEVAAMSQCFVDTWQEDYAIAQRIGQGCSYTLGGSDG